MWKFTSILKRWLIDYKEFKIANKKTQANIMQSKENFVKCIYILNNLPWTVGNEVY